MRTDTKSAKKIEKSANFGLLWPKTWKIQDGHFFRFKFNFLTLMALFKMLFLLQVCYILFLMPRNLFLKVSWNLNFSLSWNGQFWSKCSAMALYFIFRKFSSFAYSETYTMKDDHNLDLPRKFEHSSSVSLTAIPIFVF